MVTWRRDILVTWRRDILVTWHGDRQENVRAFSRTIAR